MEISAEKVKELLASLQQQHERLQRELWATEGAIALCVRLLDESAKEGKPGSDG